jgi:Tfp pilus assembly protein PilF
MLQEKTGRFEDSIRTMEKVLAIDPQNADALNFIGYSYADRGLRLDEAEEMIVQALKLKPDNGYILDSMGWVLFKKGKVAGALQYLKKAWNTCRKTPASWSIWVTHISKPVSGRKRWSITGGRLKSNPTTTY